MSDGGEDQGVLPPLTVVHTAGHAVATLLGGGQVLAVAMDDGTDCPGSTEWSLPPPSLPFYWFGGPWAEARAQWTQTRIYGTDTFGKTFDHYLDLGWHGSSAVAHGDLEKYLRWMARKQVSGDERKARESEWSQRLEAHLIAIDDVAEIIHRDGSITHEGVDAAIMRGVRARRAARTWPLDVWRST